MTHTESEKWIRHQLAYRTTGLAGSGGLLGCGFLKKNGLVQDVKKNDVPHYSLIYVLRGEGEYVDEAGQIFPLRAGWIFQRFPGHPHLLRIQADSGWAECFLAFDGTTQSTLTTFGLIPREPVYFLGHCDWLIEGFDHLLNELDKADEDQLPRRFSEAVNLMADIRLASAHHAPPTTTVLNEACRRLSTHLDQRLEISALWEGLPFRYETLRKLFHQHLGISPTLYRLRCRIDMARRLLSEPSLSVKDIAYRLGYPSPYAFSAQFKKFAGCSPHHFRSRLS